MVFVRLFLNLALLLLFPRTVYGIGGFQLASLHPPLLGYFWFFFLFLLVFLVSFCYVYPVRVDRKFLEVIGGVGGPLPFKVAESFI